MAKEFFHRDMQLFIDHRVDWARYFRLRRGDGVDVADEVDDLQGRSSAPRARSAQAIADGARDHWHEEVQLGDGQVVVPPHIAAGYEKLRAGRAALSDARPRVRRLRTAGARQLRLPRDGVARRLEPDDDHRPAGRRRARHREVRQRRAARQRYLPRFVVGRAAGRDGPDRAAGGLGPRRHRHPRRRGKATATSSTARRSSSRTAARRSIWCWRATPATFDQSKGTTNGLNLMLVPGDAARRAAERRARGARRVEARHPRLADVRHRVRPRRGVPARRAAGRASAPCST